MPARLGAVSLGDETSLSSGPLNDRRVFAFMSVPTSDPGAEGVALSVLGRLTPRCLRPPASQGMHAMTRNVTPIAAFVLNGAICPIVKRLREPGGADFRRPSRWPPRYRRRCFPGFPACNGRRALSIVPVFLQRNGV